MAFSAWDPRFPRIVPKHGVPQILYGCLEANSSTFVAGFPVFLSSNAVTIATDASFTGLAMKSGTNVTSGNVEIPVMIAGPEDEIYSYVFNGSDTEYALSNLTRGTAYDLYIGTSRVGVDASDTTGGFLVYLGPILDVNGDATYVGRFSLKDAATGALRL